MNERRYVIGLLSFISACVFAAVLLGFVKVRRPKSEPQPPSNLRITTNDLPVRTSGQARWQRSLPSTLWPYRRIIAGFLTELVYLNEDAQAMPLLREAVTNDFSDELMEKAFAQLDAERSIEDRKRMVWLLLEQTLGRTNFLEFISWYETPAL